jgi:hypothetical protein
MEAITEQSFLIWLIPLIIVLSLWETVWKIIAMWRSARNNDMAWFICIAIINTIGILPIVYILTHKKEKIEID